MFQSFFTTGTETPKYLVKLLFIYSGACALNHSEAVTKHYRMAENTLDEGFWDDVFREHEYYENDSAPTGPYPDEKGNCVGEFDVILVNYDEKLALYKEIKTGYADMNYASDQIERAEEFFEDTDWKLLGTTVLET